MAAPTFRNLPPAECAAALCTADGPFAVSEQVINGHRQRVWTHQVATFRQLIMERMQANAANPFLSSPVPDPEPFHAREALTHGETLERAIRIAAILRDHGVGVGSRVAVGGTNCTGWVLAFIALHLLGAVPVLLNNGLHVDASVHCLALVKPELVIVDDAMANQLGPIASTLKDKGVGPVWCWTSLGHLSSAARANVTELSKLQPTAGALAQVKDGAFASSVNPESDGIIYFTSGTTSMPKGVLVTQRQALHIVISAQYIPARMAMRMGASPKEATALATAPKPDGVALLSIPLFHVQGNLNWLVGAIAEGSKLVFLRRWSVPDAIKIMVSEKVGKIGGVPAIATSVLQSPLLPKDFELAQSAFGGASPPSRLPGDLVKRWPNLLVATGWGMTETNSTTTGSCGMEYVNKPLACGAAIPIADLKIVDPITRKEMPAGQAGVLLSRGSSMMKEYVNNPKATAETIDADGWLDTGDIAYIDAEGDLHIADRAKDIIIRGGENIPSAEVERALAQDDRVQEACAVPVPHAVLGECVGVAVSLAPGAMATPESIADAVFPRLRYPARPAVVVVSPKALPWNASQKILKSEVKKMVLEAWEAQGRKPMVDPTKARL
ncbi:hypothetical protein CcaverHIS002_0300860 [Cutaneotrichosporon cavernicola]|uniref:Acetyl-CoA synthetase-like protein n=1 Tax=Cutaneotrichosporon cavernicola TaxID=279322 RepID=A0AA48I5I0_9TREE|nr:uncharacterized protein CcaverHIS019_0300840 [Cutaneotrichosporon cavernicola]BEI82218.1 hypothetical protein CcaverHIS002_0300860 [Cutaneotrichosporon cavernicola]BEI90014.1 hypothetical protein CcaverHIS019_0300840 [Cutaneotrichosporon cavernicola]BEI97787.1 hypothetical protein CcaverHIS631_0300860 [Cutaneotrichosporon cavernicola]BEJ05565.1 hypothetical protein CcaverHIS641_0300870 [Cutaneotrichosporon cavernicola]